jgi:membrane-associated protease RseP (regulator of RpoE activity)
MALFLIYKRKKITIQKILGPLLYFVMYKTQIGIKLMEKRAKKFSKQLKYIGYFGIFIGFVGMVLMTYALIQNIYMIITQPGALPGVGLVLPFEVKGAFYVPFFYWIISIFIIALVHEFSHGIIAKKYGMKIKSSGIAFLGILLPVIPAAFVEPDEKELIKRPAKEQLSVFAAGPFSNILLAFIIIGITALIITPLSGAIANPNGVLITGLIDGNYSAEQAGIQPSEIIKSIDYIPIQYLTNFSNVLEQRKSGDIITLETDKGIYNVTLSKNPENNTKPYLGVFVQQNTEIKESFIKRYGRFTPPIIIWFMGLLYWLYVLNLGIGLFNLAPMGPLDGGRMLLVTLQKFLPEKKAIKYWKNIGFFFLTLILVNILHAFIN